MKRFKMSKIGSQRNFTRHAVSTHKKNLNTNPMRGGIRL